MTVIARDAVAADHLVYAWPFPIGPECEVSVQVDEAAVMCPAWLVGDKLPPGRHHWRSPDPTRPVAAYFVLTTPVEVNFDFETQFILPSTNQRIRLMAQGSVQVKCGDASLLVAQFVGLPFDSVNDGITRSVSRSIERMLGRLLIRRVVMGGTPAVVTDPVMLPHIIEELVAYNPAAGAVFGVELIRIGRLAVLSDDGNGVRKHTTAEWGRVGRETPVVGSQALPSLVNPVPSTRPPTVVPEQAPVLAAPTQRGSNPTMQRPDLMVTPRTSTPIPLAPVTMRHAAVPIPAGMSPSKTPALGVPAVGNGSGAVSSAMAMSASGEIVLRTSAAQILVPPPPPSVVERAAQSLEIQIVREDDIAEPPPVPVPVPVPDPVKVEPPKKPAPEPAKPAPSKPSKPEPSPSIIGIGVSAIRSIEDGNSLSGEIPSKVAPGSRVLFPGANGLMQSATVRQLLQGYYGLEVGSSGDTVWVPIGGVVPE